MVKTQDKTLGIIVHILGIFTWFVGALIIYLVASDKFSKDQAREALNWQLSLTIYMIISAILILILVGILFIWALGIVNLIFCIIAAVRANEGKIWKYPLTIEFFK